MMDPNKWVKTLPKPHEWVKTLPTTYEETDKKKYKLDPNKWVGTIPKINTNGSIKKYSLTIILFIFSLIFVSVIKNEARNIQKEINNLQASINILKHNLHQETLDHQVITSPENISRLSEKYLESAFASYKQSQIKQLNKKEKILTNFEKTKSKKALKETVKDKKNKMKLIFAKKIEAKKTELIKLQELYSKPEELPKELKKQVAKKIKAKRNELTELKKLFSEPGTIITSRKAQQWAGIQIVKIFLGIPIIPGR